MSSGPSYSGVYIKELASSARTITGVATSITAFIGRAARGDVNKPIRIDSFSDFERMFGGMKTNYPMGYSVRDFFVNGGSTAIIVRLIHPNSDADRHAAQDRFDAANAVLLAAKTATSASKARLAATTASTRVQNDASKTKEVKAAAAATAAAAKAGATLADVIKAMGDTLPMKLPSRAKLRLAGARRKHDLVLNAASEGIWGNSLLGRIDKDDIAPGGGRSRLFNLTIRDSALGVTERFLSVSNEPGHARALDKVLKDSSSLVRVDTLPAATPLITDIILSRALRSKLQPIIRKGNAVGATPAQKQAGIAAKKQLDAYAAPFKPADEFRYVTVSADDLGSDGDFLTPSDITEGIGLQARHEGLYALDNADLFNLLCIPPESRGGSTDNAVYKRAMAYCAMRRAMLIVDSPAAWSANKETAAYQAKIGLPSLGLAGEAARNAAIFFPRIVQSDPLREGHLDTFVPCGIVAGVLARTDKTRGVWKAPSGLGAALIGVQDLQLNLNDAENQVLNALGINCLRIFPTVGGVIWGSRTLRGADEFGDEYRYIAVRRLALYIEESLYRGTQWGIFAPNDELLWTQIRLNAGAFMNDLFREGALQGSTPKEAYFVKCDRESTSQKDVDHGVFNLVVGFAPLRPAEFVVIKLQQVAGRSEA